jgi:protein-S-isoprenylcysteine O-methyltransferase Ste14
VNHSTLLILVGAFIAVCVPIMVSAFVFFSPALVGFIPRGFGLILFFVGIGIMIIGERLKKKDQML